MACVYLEARGLENYLALTFKFFSPLSGRMDWINCISEEEAVFITNLLVYYQKKHCFTKVS